MKLLSIFRKTYLSWSQQRHLRQLWQQRLFTTDIQDTVVPPENTADTDYHNLSTSNDSEDETLQRSVDRMSSDLYKKFLVKPDQPENAHMLRVAIIGAPNAGKSTLVNSIMGWKVNAVSSKVHTTRRNTTGMMTEGDTQILFVDTPGVLTAFERRKHSCDGRMVTDPEKSVHEVDLVGVVVDVSNKWTRNQIHVEILKVLHLHSSVPSFLILNKVDCLKWKQQTLDVTRRLTTGIVNGRPMAFSRKLKSKPSNQAGLSRSQDLFEKLEKKYGKLNIQKQGHIDVDKNDTERMNEASETADEQWMKQFAAELKIHAESSDLTVNDSHVGKVQPSVVDNKVTPESFPEDFSIKKSHKLSDTVSNDKSARVLMNGPLEKSYQSEFLSQLLSQPSKVSRSVEETVDEEGSDWTQKVAKIKQATVAAKKKPGWDKFERVFIVSALYGDGILDIKDYLFLSAKPGDWQYHSSLVTDQDPHELATMCVWQAILDHCKGAIPYMVYPEIVYWQVADDNRLSIIMEVNVKNAYLAENIIGKGGSIIKEISADAKQALLNAFRCDLQFKLVIKLKKSAGRT